MNCLYCYKPTGPYEGDYHIACAKTMFGSYPPPVLTFEANQLQAVAAQQGRAGALFSKERRPKGVLQARLLPNNSGVYEIKAAADRPIYIPELEHLCLKLAAEVGIPTITNTLLNTANEDLVIIKHYAPIATLAQLTSKENPEAGTFEKLFRSIEKHSTQPGLDKVYMAERLLFSFLIGNSRLHFASTYMVDTGNGLQLAHLFETTSTALLQPALADDFSLSIAGRKNNINEETFLRFFEKAGINQLVAKNMLRRYSRIFRTWFAIIENSFLADDMKRRFVRLIMQRAERLEMM